MNSPIIPLVLPIILILTSIFLIIFWFRFMVSVKKNSIEQTKLLTRILEKLEKKNIEE